MLPSNDLFTNDRASLNGMNVLLLTNRKSQICKKKCFSHTYVSLYEVTRGNLSFIFCLNEIKTNCYEGNVGANLSTDLLDCKGRNLSAANNFRYHNFWNYRNSIRNLSKLGNN